jgi:hypothetical protein
LIEPEKSIQLKEFELLVINDIFQEKPLSVGRLLETGSDPVWLLGRFLEFMIRVLQQSNNQFRYITTVLISFKKQITGHKTGGSLTTRSLIKPTVL